MYVALTRARDHLIISSRAENQNQAYCCSDKLARVAGHNFRCGRLGRSYRTAAYEGGVLRITRNVDPAPVMHKGRAHLKLKLRSCLFC